VTNSDPKLMKWISQQMLQTSEDVALNLTKDYSDIDFRSYLGDFNIPCLVIGGAEDLSTPPVRSQELAELICGARLEVISEVGHFVQMERPCEVNRILRIFLKDNKF
jgi:pimeloyl-ACP methyl ester carboxylesterase